MVFTIRTEKQTLFHHHVSALIYIIYIYVHMHQEFHIYVVSPTSEKTEEDRPPVCPQLDKFSVREKKKKNKMALYCTVRQT